LISLFQDFQESIVTLQASVGGERENQPAYVKLMLRIGKVQQIFNDFEQDDNEENDLLRLKALLMMMEGITNFEEEGDIVSDFEKPLLDMLNFVVHCLKMKIVPLLPILYKSKENGSEVDAQRIAVDNMRTFRNTGNNCWLNSCLQLILAGLDHKKSLAEHGSPLWELLVQLQREGPADSLDVDHSARKGTNRG
jgi:hypothetical protein